MREKTLGLGEGAKAAAVHGPYPGRRERVAREAIEVGLPAAAGVRANRRVPPPAAGDERVADIVADLVGGVPDRRPEPSQRSRRDRTANAATAAGSTPASSPRQPAWADADAPPGAIAKQRPAGSRPSVRRTRRPRGAVTAPSAGALCVAVEIEDASAVHLLEPTRLGRQGERRAQAAAIRRDGVGVVADVRREIQRCRSARRPPRSVTQARTFGGAGQSARTRHARSSRRSRGIGAQEREQCGEIGRERALKLERRARHGMRERSRVACSAWRRNPCSAARSSSLGRGRQLRPAAVDGVAQQRRADVRHVHADLMRASRLELDLAVRVRAESLDDAIVRDARRGRLRSRPSWSARADAGRSARR